VLWPHTVRFRGCPMPSKALLHSLLMLAAWAAVTLLARAHLPADSKAQLSPASVYTSRAPANDTAADGGGKPLLVVLAPNTAVHGAPLPAAQQPPGPVPQAEACGAECRSRGSACGWFQWCGAQVGLRSAGDRRVDLPTVFQRACPLPHTQPGHGPQQRATGASNTPAVAPAVPPPLPTHRMAAQTRAQARHWPSRSAACLQPTARWSP